MNRARYKFFLDLPDGVTVELTDVWHESGSLDYAQNYTGLTSAGRRLSATRMVKMIRNPSRHKCDSRCLHASGKVMRCECSCGGKNHGKGR